MDYFALLPPEITQLIFDNLRPFDTAVRLPLSKSLVPFQQRRLFRRIRISLWNRFEQVCEASRRPSSPLQYIEDLLIVSYPQYGTEQGQWTPPISALTQLFRSLVQVKTLRIESFERAVSVLLDPGCPLSSLPILTTLQLENPFNRFEDPFDPTHYTALPYYTNLTTFTLSDTRLSDEIYNSLSTSTFDLAKSRIRHLSLDGDLTASAMSVQRLLASVGDLETLSLKDTSETPRLYYLLDGVRNCAGLKKLVLAPSNDDDYRFDDDGLTPPANGDFGRILLRFPALSSWTLGSLCDATSLSFYDALRQLSLDHLAFGRGVKLSLANLARFVASGGMQHKLKTITFDIVEGERGTRIEDVGRPYDDDEIDGWNVYPDWVEPRWTEDFAEADLVDLIEVAKREGIEVKGTAVEAIGIIREIGLEYEKLDENSHRREVITGW